MTSHTHTHTHTHTHHQHHTHCLIVCVACSGCACVKVKGTSTMRGSSPESSHVSPAQCPHHTQLRLPPCSGTRISSGSFQCTVFVSRCSVDILRWEHEMCLMHALAAVTVDTDACTRVKPLLCCVFPPLRIDGGVCCVTWRNR